jgi:alpha-tubulin suppressor-like RCC1 family protein
MRRRQSLAVSLVVVAGLILAAAVAKPAASSTGDAPTGGSLLSWGSNIYGALGRDTSQGTGATPGPVPGMTDVVSVAGSRNHGAGFGLAVRADGSVWGWGLNLDGVLGANVQEQTTQATPTPIPGLSGIKSVAAGLATGYALRSDGTVWSWGRGIGGQLGNGGTTNASIPAQIQGLPDIVQVAASSGAGFALDTSGQVWSWGNGALGVLGNGITTNSLVPGKVTGLTNVTAIAGTNSSGMALTSDGRVWSWGVSFLLGTGATDNSAAPVAAAGITTAVRISGAADTELAVLADGTLWNWGLGGSGQLGNGTTTTSRVPVQVNLAGKVTTATGTNAASFALMSDGSVWSWGWESGGRLGNGQYENTAVATPIQISSLSGVTAIAGGTAAGYAIASGSPTPPPNPPPTTTPDQYKAGDQVTCTRSHPTGAPDEWAYTAVVGESDGLQLHNLRFGPRLVARLISVPYIKTVGFGLDGSGHPTTGHLTVTPNTVDADLQTSLLSVNACFADPGTNAHPGVSATYKVLSLSTGLTFLVQQSYRFDPFEKDERCEATETAPCVRFWPTVTWALKDEAPSPNIGLEIVQRFEFDPDAVGHGAADVIADTFTLNNLGADNLSSDGYLKREDVIGPRFDGGPMLNHGPALYHGQTVYWENWHQTGRERVGLPSPISAGCTECVHAHWSWFGNLGPKSLNAANTISCGSAYCWTDGKPEILDGSKQTVYAGWVKWNEGEQQPDPGDWRSLIDPKDQEPSKVDPANHRLVFYWDARTTASGSPSDKAVTINGAGYDVGDSYWPQLDNKRHGGNGSMFLVPARRFTANDETAPCFNRVKIAPDYEASKGYYDGSQGSPRIPAGYVLPVRLTLERPAVCAYTDPRNPVGYRDQGPYYLRVKSTGPRLLNADSFYSANFGGAPWVRVYSDTHTGGRWELSADPQQVLKYDYRQGYMLAMLVFDRPPTAADTSFELNAAPNGVATYEYATGNW